MMKEAQFQIVWSEKTSLGWNKDLNQAREWSKWVSGGRVFHVERKADVKLLCRTVGSVLHELKKESENAAGREGEQ